MIKYIVTRNAWGDGMKAETSIVPELILPFEGVKAKCREIGVEIVSPDAIHPNGKPSWSFPDEKPAAFIFIDCPEIGSASNFQWCVDHKIPFLLLISENLYLQPNKTYAEVGKHAAKILSYEAKPLYPEKTVRLRYPVDLENGLVLRQKALQGERPYLLGMVAGMKHSNAPGDLYRKRAEWAFQLSEALGDRFALWGPGWKEAGFKSAKGFLPPSLTAKHDALSQCEFALCLENNNSIPGYVTEKLFNALIAGCIPIYEGDTSEIPPNVALLAQNFAHPLNLLSTIEMTGPNGWDIIRNGGDKFLKEATQFSTQTHINTLFEAIKSIL